MAVASNGTSDFIKMMTPSLWVFVKWLIYIVIGTIVLGFIVGLFTYWLPERKSRRRGKAGPSDDTGMISNALFIGENISHIVLRLIFNKGRHGDLRHEWLDDTQIIHMLRGMSPGEFEEFSAKMFRAMGYETEQVGGSGDGGIDIEMTKDGRHYVVQCKKFIKRKVDPHDVRDFYGAIGDRHIDGKGFFITTHIFTSAAEQFAEGKPMELIDGTKLVEMIHQSGVLSGSVGPKKEQGTFQEDRCLTCGGNMVVRTNRKNGNRFLGCVNYPKCRFTKPL